MSQEVELDHSLVSTSSHGSPDGEEASSEEKGDHEARQPCEVCGLHRAISLPDSLGRFDYILEISREGSESPFDRLCGSAYRGCAFCDIICKALLPVIEQRDHLEVIIILIFTRHNYPVELRLRWRSGDHTSVALYSKNSKAPSNQLCSGLKTMCRLHNGMFPEMQYD